MVKLDSNLYRAIVLKLLRYSNAIAVIMIIVAIYVCFSSNSWLYALILGLSSIYLGWLTSQYIISETDDFNEQCSLQYGCQVASFNSRLSIVSNTTMVLFGLAFTALIVRYLVIDDQLDSAVINNSYIIGFIKLMLMYIMSDKIHTSQLLVSILYRYTQSIRFLNIDLDPRHPELRYPVIFLDGSRISATRYRVTGYAKNVTTVFNPQLSLGDNSTIEYKFIAEDKDHVVHAIPLYDKYESPSCFFRCHVVVKNAEAKPSEN